jgi:hypothetical protein
VRIVVRASILTGYAALVAGLPQLGGKTNCQADMAGGLNSLGGVTKVGFSRKLVPVDDSHYE